jgi:hypothetical protein
MSTSNSYSFTVNRDQIIRDAMLNIGRLDEIEAPTASEASDCAFKLNMMIKQWQGRGDFSPGLKVWTRRRSALFLSGTTGTYQVGPTAQGWATVYATTLTTSPAVLGASSVVVESATGVTAGYYIGVQLDSGTLFWTTVSSVINSTINLASVMPSSSGTGSAVFTYQTTAQQPINIEAVVLRTSNNDDIPIRLLTQQDYDYLPSKASNNNTSDPTAIYYEFQLGNSYLYTDCSAAQDVTKRLIVTYLEPVQDILQASDNFEYPQEWFLALSWGLSKQIASMFSAPWTPLMEENQKLSLAIAQQKDPERITLFFQSGAEDS